MTKMFLWTLFLALVSYSQAVPTEDLRLESKGPTKIVGGGPVDWPTVPYLLSLQWDGHHYCAASRIDDYHCLTAAHCLYGYQAVQPNDTVGYGDNDRTTLPHSRICEQFYIHPGYNPSTLENDFGVIRLTHPFAEDDTSSAIRPCEYCTNDESGIPCWTFGWGTTFEGANYLPTNLQGVNIMSVDQTTCNSNYSAYGAPIKESMVCAGQKGMDACQGDSGGPLVQDYEPTGEGEACLFGITSWGVGCGQEQHPGVWSLGCAAVPWVDATLTESYKAAGKQRPDGPWSLPPMAP